MLTMDKILPTNFVGYKQKLQVIQTISHEQHSPDIPHACQKTLQIHSFDVCPCAL